MRITYDPKKNALNIVKHGLSFDAAYDFDFLGAVTRIDARKEYGEKRFVATGYLGSRLHILCYVEAKDGLRVISFRKANIRERRMYEKAKEQATDE